MHAPVDAASAFDALPSSTRFTPDQLDVVYRLGFAALAAGQWPAAVRYFEWLVLYGGSDPRHWRGLATGNQGLERPAQALWQWTMVALLEPMALDATLQAAHCQAQLGQVDEARQTLALVCRHAEAADPVRLQAGQLLARLHPPARVPTQGTA